MRASAFQSECETMSGNPTLARLPSEFLVHTVDKDPRVPMADEKCLIKLAKAIQIVAGVVMLIGTFYYWVFSNSLSTAYLDMGGRQGEELLTEIQYQYDACTFKSYWNTNFYISSAIHHGMIWDEETGDMVTAIDSVQTYYDHLEYQEVVGVCIYGPDLLSSLSLAWSAASGILAGGFAAASFYFTTCRKTEVEKRARGNTYAPTKTQAAEVELVEA